MSDKIKKSFLDYFEINNLKTKMYYVSEAKKSFESDEYKKAMEDIKASMTGLSDEEIKYKQEQVFNNILVESVITHGSFLDLEKDMFSRLLDYVEKKPAVKTLIANNKKDSEEYNKVFLEELFKTIQTINHDFTNIFKFVPISPISDNKFEYINSETLIKLIDKNLYDKYSDFIKKTFNKEMKDVLFNKDCIDVIKVDEKYYYIKPLIFNSSNEKLDINQFEITSFPFICS